MDLTMIYPLFPESNHLAQGHVADCMNFSPPLISRKFQEFGGIWVNLGKFGKFQENSGELSEIQWGFVWRLI